MRRFRLSTLMLLIAIAALGVALVVKQRRAARREAELRDRLNSAENKLWMLEQQNLLMQRRAARREAELQAEMAALRSRLTQSWPVVLPPRRQEAMPRMRADNEDDLIKRLNRQLSGQ
jgi:hypothetical protein